jgi:hypothetical protein
MNPTVDDSRPVFTPRQGQYLAFIHAYTLVNGRPRAEADMMQFLRVTPPTRPSDGAQPPAGRLGLTTARRPPGYCRPAQPRRLTRTESRRHSTGQHHRDAVLAACRPRAYQRIDWAEAVRATLDGSEIGFIRLSRRPSACSAAWVLGRERRSPCLRRGDGRTSASCSTPRSRGSTRRGHGRSRAAGTGGTPAPIWSCRTPVRVSVLDA